MKLTKDEVKTLIDSILFHKEPGVILGSEGTDFINKWLAVADILAEEDGFAK